MNKSDYDKYYKKGGTYVIPVELFNELFDELERLNNILKETEKCIDYYAIENDDFSKFYNNEEIEILKIIGSDKE